MSLFILEYLSVSTEEFKNYFNIETPFPRYITALVFRMIANLHCFNPEVSPPDQKHFLIKKIAYYFTTIWKPGEDGEPICTSKVSFLFFFFFFRLEDLKFIYYFRLIFQILQLIYGYYSVK